MWPLCLAAPGTYHQPLNRAGEPFRGRVPKLSVNFEEILLRAQRTFEDQNKVLESSIIVINSCSVIINGHYNYIV